MEKIDNSDQAKAQANAQKDKDKEKKPEDAKKVSVFRLYRFANTFEKAFVALGIIVSTAFGVCLPLMAVIMGDSIQGFGEATADDTMRQMEDQCVLMLYLALGSFVLAGLTEIMWSFAGDNLGIRVRKMYLEAVLKKDVSWFDLNKPQELPTKIVSLISKYQEGIGDKIGKVIMSVSMAISGLIVGFVYGWQLTLVIVGLSPITMGAALLIGWANSLGVETTKRGYAKCGGYAEEALSAIRTVYAFCAETVEKTKYLNELSVAQKSTVKNSIILGVAIGLINFAMSLSHGLGYFIGSFFIEYKIKITSDKIYDTGTVMTVFFGALFASFSLGMIAPQMKDIGKAQVSAYDIYEIIDSVANVNKNAPTEKIPLDKFQGKIEFHNVTFFYPTRPDVKVLDNFNMVFESGKMVGICGETGSGKSTIIQLLERFYTPTSGTITVDGIDINTLDLKWWREMIGYVGQEPILFNTTIKANIEYGCPGASQEEIEKVAKLANAEEFINKLESKYDTITGSEGNKMSGGQKQRLAIARCLIKRPRILLLDEATSALDNTSERRVQEAFNELQREQGMTVLVIAHRLSTIKKADRIIVLHDGVLKEEGTDTELRDKNTIYANLCRLQEGAGEGGEEEVEISGEKVSLKKNSTIRKSVVAQEEEKKEEDPEVVKKQEEEKAKVMKEQKGKYRSALLSENLQHKLPFFGAMFSGILCGGYMPVTGILFGMVSMDLLNEPEMRRLVNLDFIGFVVSGFCALVLTFIMFWLFGLVGSKITFKLRNLMYTHVMTMEIGWFDLPANLPSNLNNVLAEGTEKINDVIGMIVGFVFQTVSALIIAIVVAFVLAWRISLIVLACVPLFAFSAFIDTKFQVGFAAEREVLYKSSMQILTEAVKNFRTVASFSSEERILKMYSEALEKPLAQSKKKNLTSGLLYGFSQAIVYFVYSGLFYFTALFAQRAYNDPRDTFMAVYSLLFSAASMGQMQQYAPDMGKAYASLFSVYGTLEQKPTIVSPKEPSTNEIKGMIEFKKVFFKYPTRKDYVLQDFSATIHAGEKVAIVGISGSGKSTVIQLLERFYDVESGEILVDGVDIKEYALHDLRQAIGYVPQEPVLFDTTIEDNVKYGSENRTRAEVEEACEIADAIDFIMKDSTGNEVKINMPDATEGSKTEKALTYDIGKGYERKVGAKGSLLSGGQKQRLAIARAVLKKPKIMLFDEATSALDSETEKVVQKALNQVSQGRTSIVIAHRLGTIDDNDTILVLENGKVVESGKKQELDNRKGSFHKLYGGVMAASKAKKQNS